MYEFEKCRYEKAVANNYDTPTDALIAVATSDFSDNVKEYIIPLIAVAMRGQQTQSTIETLKIMEAFK
jgi:hypothetical protein